MNGHLITGFLLFVFTIWALCKIGQHSARRQRKRTADKIKADYYRKNPVEEDTSMTYLIMDDFIDRPSQRGYHYEDVPANNNVHDDGGPEW